MKSLLEKLWNDYLVDECAIWRTAEEKELAAKAAALHEQANAMLAEEQRAAVEQYLDALCDAGYDARVGAVCWMQGESDTTDFKASHYLENQKTFVSYLRSDLQEYAEDGGICFIDAGISNSPYCEPAYPQINAAKAAFAEDSHLNLYFSTIDAGLITTQEPEGDPDWGHYDALCELELGRMFAQYLLAAEGKER